MLFKILPAQSLAMMPRFASAPMLEERFPDKWDMEAQYDPYVPAPTGFDASRFPDRSGEGNQYQYGEVLH
ncbi:hypothetical protein GUITHDRAFT_102901 [Guillardia theta CCMP2712]|uniref:Uncharacterized protein n=1 Tax=Guillardia theta (strain CCMP2712) TaxID=905079 RepID=L1JTW0_GUITC|nr:hypothetical protein GUITHDRAFT_102901 [Guillardia theta CCMP2712]EKX51640.1 hypothetical protein GUITHDRAFT_102901 [Guillardia theta CCMP2712]|eukprot:XP_005838620.1 hypothetical protein GUITHDRAFT_102901 [Guillardia theta CCMP2712]